MIMIALKSFTGTISLPHPLYSGNYFEVHFGKWTGY